MSKDLPFSRLKLPSGFLLLLSILLFTSTALAQTTSFGIKFGFNSSNFAGDLYVSETGDDTYRWINRYNAGLFFTYSRSSNLAFTCELNYVNIGSDFQSVTSRKLVEKEIQLTYLEVPVMAKIFFLNGENVKPNIFLGPSLNFLFVAIEDTHDKTLSGATIKEVNNYDVWNDYNTFEVSLISGFGMNVALWHGFWLNLDFRFSYGITDIMKDKNLKTRQNTFTVNAGFTIPY